MSINLSRGELRMNRVVLCLAALLLVGWSLLDPYTVYSNAGDAVTHAPIWQTSLAVLDLGLLGSFMLLAWRGRTPAAMTTLVAKGLWPIAITIFYGRPDGLCGFA